MAEPNGLVSNFGGYGSHGQAWQEKWQIWSYAQGGDLSHPEAESLLRPEVGTQPQFKKKKPPKTYRYDSSLSPALDWDGQNPSRELGEWLIGLIEQAAALPAPHKFASPQELKREDGQVVATVRGLQDAVEQLKRLGQPFLNWAGKAERLSFDVPTLPLFVHERLVHQGHHRNLERPP